MKAGIFSVFFAGALWASSALAVPVADNVVVARADGNDVNGAVHDLENLVNDDIGLGEVVNGVASRSSKPTGTISSPQDLIATLQHVLKDMKTNTHVINGTLAQVKSGKMTKAQADAPVKAQLKDMHYKLTDILKKILDAAGLNVQGTDIDKVLTLVVALVSELLFTVKSVLTILGVRPQLASILHSVFNLLSEVLAALIGLVTGLVPGLVAALSPLLAGLGNGVLAPLLTGVAALLAGLTGP